MNGITFDTVIEETDLGVLIDEELKFRKPIPAAVSKANQTLSIIKSTFDTL